MSTPTRQRQPLAAATDPPGALVPYRKWRTHVPTNLRQRQDPLALALVGAAVLGGIAAIAVAAHQIRSGVDATPAPAATTTPQTTEPESPTPLGLVLFGGLLMAAITLRNRGNHSHDCPKQCTDNQSCRCPQRHVIVRVDLNN